MRCKFIAILSLVASALVFTACDSNQTTMAAKETNVLGIITYKPGSYAHTGPNTFAINTDELYTRREFSGDQVSFFWGLVTIKDY